MNTYIQTQSEDDRQSENRRAATLRVLLLDGNLTEAADLRAKMADARHVAFSVRTAHTLSEAVQMLDSQRFDAILSDSNTPSGQGLATFAELRSAAPETPIVALTTEYREAEALELVRTGAQDYVMKSRLNSAAIERILLYCIERQRVIRRSDAQHAVSRVLAESESLAAAELAILRVLCETCGCDRGQFWQFDPWSGDLALARTWTRPGSVADTNFERQRLGLGEGLPGMAWGHGEPEWLENLAEHEQVPQCKLAANRGLQSALAFPIKLSGDALGVIELLSRGTIETDEEILLLLMNAGAQFGQFMARKLAEKEREHLTRERLLILDCAAEGIYGVDLNGCITFMNRAAAAMLQCTPLEATGKNSHEIFCRPEGEKSSHSADQCPIARTLATRQGNRAVPNDLRRTNDTRFEAEFSVFPLVEAGEMKGAVICFNDVTDRKRMEVELRHSQKLEAVGALAAGIAHEINTPIQFVGDNTRFLQDAFRDVSKLVKTYGELCEAMANGKAAEDAQTQIADARKKADWDYLEKEIPKALEQALDGVNRVATIVRGMKEFSHVDRSPNKAAADLNKALESTLIVARNELKYVADVEVHFGEIPPVFCHLGDMNQVFLNLLINAAHAIADAVKGTQKKGRIGVKTTQEGDRVEVAISDTGTGIPEGVRDKIFDPFFTTKEVGKGTGQGLALARAIVVEKHGGTLTFETEVGKGTTFYIRLPLGESTESQGDATS
ncbi:MAG TPA: ATP-binding protein [Candidatus Aquilonibacter sp.]|nr:ATP-binding protein [Candidatus Aquilonibacter sp.]